jgi:hypothetical protein
VKPLDDHDQRFFFQLNSCGHSPHVTSSLMVGWVCLLWICLALSSVHITHLACYWKVCINALYASPLSVQALQSRSCFSYLSDATTAAWSLEWS